MNFNQTHASSLNFDKVQDIEVGTVINFGKEHPAVTKLRTELYWNGEADGDISMIISAANGKAIPGVIPGVLIKPGATLNGRPHPDVGKQDPNATKGMIWYNNLQVPGVVHSGDVQYGQGDDSAPEEVITTTFAELDASAQGVMGILTTFPDKSTPTIPVPLSNLANCKVLVIDDVTNDVLYRHQVPTNVGAHTSMEIFKYSLDSGLWVYEALNTVVGKSAQALADIHAKHF